MKDHVNSKKVTINRLPNFLQGAQGKDVDEYMSNSSVGIGSYFESPNSMKIASGLDFKEEELLLPLIIDIPKEDRDFRKQVASFYTDIETKIPFRGGLELEIGLQESNDKKVSDDNMPLKLMDYLRYRHLKNHPQVADSLSAGGGNMMKRFYIFDKDAVTSKNSKSNKQKDVAYQIYLKVKNDTSVVDQMLTLLGVNVREYASNKDKDSIKEDLLRDLAQSKPDEVIAINSDEQLEIKSWIKRMVREGILLNVGGKFMDAQDKQVRASSLDEMVAYFIDIENSNEVIAMKARLQEAESAPVAAARKMTQV